MFDFIAESDAQTRLLGFVVFSRLEQLKPAPGRNSKVIS